MSYEQEVALGKSSDPAIQAQYGIYPDEKIQAFINEKGQQMAKISHRPELEYFFRVVDSDVVNAFALPGGYVYFTRGILAHFNNEAEFAGVLGHEIGHITARHGARQQTSRTLGQIGLIGGMILSPQVRQMGQQATQALQLLFLSHSRDHESESDKLGVEYSSTIGYDANYMANFFKTLQRLSSQAGHELPTFMSTHPDPGDRFLNVGTMAKAWQQKNPGQYQVNREKYLKMIDGIIYGPDPRQGFVDNNQFIHPGLKFRFQQPANFTLDNQPTQVRMISEKQDALVTFTFAQGVTLEEAAQKTAENQKLTVGQYQKSTINGMPAISFEASAQGEENTTYSLLTHIIEKDSIFYLFQGVTTSNLYATYRSTFASVANSFDTETRAAMLNIKPEVVSVRTVRNNTTLQQFFVSQGIDSNRHNELAILNSMELTDQLTAGTLVKVIEREK